MRYASVLIVCVLPLLRAEPAPEISDVQVVGAPVLPAKLETRAGDALDPARLSHDVKTLYQSQRLSDVQVETVPDGDRVRVVFRAAERHMDHLERIHVEPQTPGINMGIEPGAEIDDQVAQQIATSLRKQLEGSGYPDAAVTADLEPASPGKVDLDVHIDKGRQVDIVGPVTFTGDLEVPPSQLRHALRATSSKTMIPLLWSLKAGYSEDAIEADAANLRSFYYKRGYFDVAVRPEPATISNGKARLEYAIDAGPRYEVREFSLSGRNFPVKKNFEFPAEEACKSFFADRRKAERRGILDFAASIDVQDLPSNGPRKQAEASASISTGPAYQVGLISFRGNTTLNDLTLRRMMVLDEGAPMDEILLRKSLGRISSTHLFQPLTTRSVNINTPPGSHYANVTISLREEKKHSWAFSGPVGPGSAFGPLEFSISSRLPSWGRGIFELSTYAVSMRLMYYVKPLSTIIPFLPNQRFFPLVDISRPMLPGQPLISGGEFVPQFGPLGMGFAYAVSQARSLMNPLFDTERSYLPGLPVTIERNGNAQGTMYCEPAKTKLDWARQLSGIAVNVFFSFMPI
jgi:outer membrane protein insertion porin family